MNKSTISILTDILLARMLDLGATKKNFTVNKADPTSLDKYNVEFYIPYGIVSTDYTDYPEPNKVQIEIRSHFGSEIDIDIEAVYSNETIQNIENDEVLSEDERENEIIKLMKLYKRTKISIEEYVDEDQTWRNNIVTINNQEVTFENILIRLLSSQWCKTIEDVSKVDYVNY